MLCGSPHRVKMEKRYESKNGVSVYTYKNEALNGFHLSLFFKAGSIYEEKDECGITHFFEHVAIRNVNKLMGDSLYVELDRRAVEFNASTYSEMCQFYTGGVKENFSFCASLITKVLSPIILDKKGIDAERKRIKAEIRESDEKSSLSSLSAESVHSGTSLASSILGTQGSVDKINRSRLNSYREKITNKENVFFYLTGNFAPSDVDILLAEIEKYDIKSGEMRSNVAPVSRYFFRRTESENSIIIKNSSSTSLKFTFDIDMEKVTVPEGDLIYDILFNGYSSPFFVKMSEEEGMFYDISSSSDRYKNIGNFSLSFEVKEKELYRSLEMALSIFSSFTKTVLSDEDMMKATYVKNSRLLFDDARELAFTFAYDNHVMDQGYRDIDARSKCYEAITPERLNLCAKEIFRRSNLTLVIKANAKKTDLQRILSLMKAYLD